MRYVDDTFIIQQEEHKQNFLEHINNMDPAIKFTVETNHQYGAIPFLDTIVKPEADDTPSLTVYRKPMHTDKYLQWHSHHNLAANTVLSAPFLTELGQFVSSLNSLIKKHNISGRL